MSRLPRNQDLENRKNLGCGVAPLECGPSAVMAFDALLARPLGAAATVVGTTLFLGTLPMSGKTASTDEAAWGLVGRPYNYTFNRPLGRSEPKFEEQGVFRP